MREYKINIYHGKGPMDDRRYTFEVVHMPSGCRLCTTINHDGFDDKDQIKQDLVKELRKQIIDKMGVI